MSCRTTAGGSASTSLARATTRLTDSEIQGLFHALKREGAHAHTPSELDMQAWRHRQEELLDRMTVMSETKKDSIRQRLYRSRGEATPDGATFYAWSRVEARARQEVAIRNITTAIDLDPPGSHADRYVLDQDGRPTEIWYASYGSNLHQDRFLTYLQGGTPEGSSRTYPGCTNPSLPTGDIPIRWSGRPHFALTSRVWGGGIAFMDETKDAQGLGRAYKITAQQFDEVVHFENSGMTAAAATTIDLDNVLTTGRLTTGPGAYETMVHVGDHNGAPVLTFTAPFTTMDAIAGKGRVARGAISVPVRTNKPSASYVRMIGQGLAQTFGMDEVAQADYIRGCPGGDQWERRDLVKMLRLTELPPPKPPKARPTTELPGSTGHPTLPLPGLFSNPPHPPTAASLAAAGVNPNRQRQATEPRNHRNPFGRTGPKTPQPAPVPVLNIPAPRKDGNYFPKVSTYPTRQAQDKGIHRWTVAAAAQEEKIVALNQKLTNIQHHVTLTETKGETPTRRVLEELDRTQLNLWHLGNAYTEATRKIADAARQTPPDAPTPISNTTQPPEEPRKVTNNNSAAQAATPAATNAAYDNVTKQLDRARKRRNDGSRKLRKHHQKFLPKPGTTPPPPADTTTNTTTPGGEPLINVLRER